MSRILACDAREVNENVFAVILTCNESVTVLGIEPLYSTNETRTFTAILSVRY